MVGPPKKDGVTRLFFPRFKRESTKCCQTHPTVHPLRRKPLPPLNSQDVQWRYSRPRESQLAPWTKDPRIVRGTVETHHVGSQICFFLAGVWNHWIFFPNLHKDYWILYEIHSFGSRKVLCFGIILLRQFGLLNLMIGEGYLVYAGWFNSRRSLEVTDNPWKGQPSQKGHELNRLVYRFCWWLIHSLGSRHFPPYDRKKWHTGVLEHSASRVFSCLKGSRPTWSNNKNQAETYSQL